MNARSALRRAVLTLGAAGSLMPGVWVAPAVGARPPVGTEVAPPVGGAPGALRVDAAWRRTWSWPLSPTPVVLAPFVAPRSAYGAGHRGVDLRARQGQAVLAVDAGVVSHVGIVAGRGTVSIAHASGLRSTYEPVRGAVSAGAAVAEGGVLGVVAGRSHCGRACLHLGALADGAYVDPRPLLAGGPVVLLPQLGGR